MSRMTVSLVVILVVMVIGLVLLSRHAHEKPLSRVEKVVSLANLQG
ncbi:hypothetical protein [uncultured Sphingomonas sp.]